MQLPVCSIIELLLCIAEYRQWGKYKIIVEKLIIKKYYIV